MDREAEPSTPLSRLASKFGGVKAVADLANRSVKSVYRWAQDTEDGGNGGLVPGPAQRKMVANARARGLPLEFSEFAPREGETVR